MLNKELLMDIFTQINESLSKIEYRFSSIKNVADFTDSPQGTEKLDSICMQLIAIGESIKNVDKITNKKFLLHYDEMDWKGVMGMRDIISHHYFDIDADIVFNVCKHHIPFLKSVVRKIIHDLEHQ